MVKVGGIFIIIVKKVFIIYSLTGSPLILSS